MKTKTIAKPAEEKTLTLEDLMTEELADEQLGNVAGGGPNNTSQRLEAAGQGFYVGRAYKSG